jgi:hypothetical protein
MVNWMASGAGRGDSSWFQFEDAFSAMPARSRKVPTLHYRHSLLAGMSMASERERRVDVDGDGIRVLWPGNSD